jgi:hypothetical protein
VTKAEAREKKDPADDLVYARFGTIPKVVRASRIAKRIEITTGDGDRFANPGDVVVQTIEFGKETLTIFAGEDFDATFQELPEAGAQLQVEKATISCPVCHDKAEVKSIVEETFDHVRTRFWKRHEPCIATLGVQGKLPGVLR